jgi:hypothetical protein
MAVLSTTTKGKVGAKATRVAIKNPRLLRAGAQAVPPIGKIGFRVGKPLTKRRVRKGVQNVQRLGSAARSFGESLVTYGPQAAYELGLVEPPKPKRTAPRVAAGIVIGASAVYFLEPEHGREHREKVAQLVS